MATLREVAALAGVSPTTATNVFQARRKSRADNVRRVWEAARTLGYEPRLAFSRVLAETENAKTVALVVADLQGYFEAELISGIEEVLSRNGYDLIVASHHERPSELEEFLDGVRRRRNSLAGLVLMPPTVDAPTVLYDIATSLPVVNVDRRLRQFPCPFIGVNNIVAGYDATEHLIVQHGCRNLWLLSQTNGDLITLEERREGFERAIGNHGLELHHPIMLPPDFHTSTSAPLPLFSELIDLLTRVKDGHVDGVGIFSSKVSMTALLLRAIRYVGVDVPRQVKFVSYDEAMWWDVVSPTITSVNQRASSMGSQAAETLMSLILHRTIGPEVELPRPEIIRRESCGCVPTE